MLVPGYGELLDSRDYVGLVSIIEERGYRVIFYEPCWTKSGEVWIQGLKDICSAKGLIASQTVLAGFSYGAFICLAVAASWQPKKLWLWSLASPHGPLAYEQTTPAHIRYGQRISRQTQTTMVIGEKEVLAHPGINMRVNETHKSIAHSCLLQAEGAGHDPLHPGYIKAIRVML